MRSVDAPVVIPIIVSQTIHSTIGGVGDSLIPLGMDGTANTATYVEIIIPEALQPQPPTLNGANEKAAIPLLWTSKVIWARN